MTASELHKLLVYHGNRYEEMFADLEQWAINEQLTTAQRAWIAAQLPGPLETVRQVWLVAKERR